MNAARLAQFLLRSILIMLALAVGILVIARVLYFLEVFPSDTWVHVVRGVMGVGGVTAITLMLCYASSYLLKMVEPEQDRQEANA